MNKFFLVICLLFLADTQAWSQKGDEDAEMFNNAKARDQRAIDEAMNGWWTASMKTHDQRIQWWRDAKFGVFIHWGIYSLPGGEWKGKKVSGYAEHLMRKEKISRKEYLELAHQFNPINFNADEWIMNAKKAGMKYFIITAKHHDGFAVFDSDVSDFTIVKQSPFKRDPMAELAAAAKKHGIKFGFYYSHAFDWEHPDAPGNDWEYKNPGGDDLIGGANWFDNHPEWLPKAQKYVNEKAIPQIKELIKKYHPDILWFDTPHKLPLSENIKILKAIRETDPNVVVNGRLARSGSTNFGDYKNTGDRSAEFYPVADDWEAVPTTNESYGYSKFDSSHKPVSHFIRLLANAASRGGNILMNIGPKGDGSFDAKDKAILKGIGSWMAKNSESIYGTQASGLPLQSWGVTTAKGNELYLHVFNYPADRKLYVGGLKNRQANIYLLEDKTPLTYHQQNDELVIDLPKKIKDTVNTVVVLQLNEPLIADTVRYISSNTNVTRLLAYDARQAGSGFSFGDGKTDRYYVDGWKKKNQSLSWTFKTSATTTYTLLAKYIAGDAVAGGTFDVQVDDKTINQQVVTDKIATKVITQDIGKFTLNKGIHTITIKPIEISKQELMKLLELQLIVVDNQKIK